MDNNINKMTTADSNYKNILDLVENVGIYVIKKDNYEILYLNNYFKQLVPHVKLGDKCFKLCPELCENCPLTNIENKEKNKILISGLHNKDMTEITAKPVLWNNTTPAYIISVVIKTLDKNDKLEEIKKRNVYSVLAEVYPVIIALNFTKGTYNIINNQKPQAFNISDTKGSLTDLFKYTYKGICNEQKEEFQQKFSPTNIKQAFESGKREINMACFSPNFNNNQTQRSMLHWRIVKASNFRSGDLLGVFTSRCISDNSLSFAVNPEDSGKLTERHFLNFAYSDSEYISLNVIIKENTIICIEKNERLKNLLGVDDTDYNECLRLCMDSYNNSGYMENIWQKASKGQQLILAYSATNLKTHEKLYFDFKAIKVKEHNGYPIYNLMLADKTKLIVQKQYDQKRLTITDKDATIFKYYVKEDKLVYMKKINGKPNYHTIENYCSEIGESDIFPPKDYRKLKLALKNKLSENAEISLKYYNEITREPEDVLLCYRSVKLENEIIKKYGFFEKMTNKNLSSINNKRFIEQMSAIILDLYDVMVEYDFNANICYELKLKDGEYVKELIPNEISEFINFLICSYVADEYKDVIKKIHTQEYLNHYFENGEKELTYDLRIKQTKYADFTWYSLTIRPLGFKTNRYIALVKNINDSVLAREKQEREISEANALTRHAVLEKELSENSSSIMLSQINPHFIFNTLNCIKGLTLIDSKRACSIIDTFSKYLRSNLSAVNKKEPIAFITELEHIETYLTIETTRFPNIEIEYDLVDTNFYIPPMTIQPIVENAVVHGVCQKIGGGKIKICSKIIENYVIISIIDNGKGFSYDKNTSYLPSNHSLSIISQSLATLVKGELLISSKLDEGTEVVIKIPVENVKGRFYLIYENDFSR